MTAQQLKNSILQMAVSGKLVPQDPNDEPASVLLERIRAEKEQLIKQGKIKKEKNPSIIFRSANNIPYAFCEQIGKEIHDISDEIPFDIPESWEWVKIKDIFQIEMGQSPDGNSVFKGTNGIEFHQGKIYFSDRIILKSNQVTNNPKKFAEPYSILLCVRAPVGKVNITDRRLCIGRGLCALKPYNMLNLSFSYLVFQSLEENFIKQATGTTFKAITAEVVKNQFIPVPPLPEQHRIVAKIEELLPYIEKYEKAETELSSLNENFPEQLKKSILQEAVQGKLVPQDLNDEPASVLLERIRAEKQTLVKAGKIKKDKHESVIITRDKIPYEIVDGKERCIADEVPFEIPESWCWTKVGCIAFVTKLAGFEYTSRIASNLQRQGIPLFKGKNVQDGKLIYNFEAFISEELSDELERSQINKKCLLTPYVGTIGNIAIFPGNFKAHLGSNVGKIEIFNGDHVNILEEYVVYFFRSFTGYAELTKYKKATAQESISIDAIRNSYVPVPPLDEQRRIVTKIEKLMKFCEML